MTESVEGDRVEIVTSATHPDFLDLPWGDRLEAWDTSRLVKMAHGISRHVVRFVRYDERVYALKETTFTDARDEYRTLRKLREARLPVVEPVGFVSRTSADDSGVLITRYLDFSLPYWYVMGQNGGFLADRLIDAGVVLLVRLHLEGVFWGDCSLSNILWRRDAGAVMAYLVDAETTEQHDTMSDQMRKYDIEIARENIVGGLLNLQQMGRVAPEIDPIRIGESLHKRYEALWAELTRVESFRFDERWRIEQRVRRINELGFDVDEIEISTDGQQLSMKPVLVEEGHHSRDLRRRTGLEVQENQARRLLADIEQYRAWLERSSGAPTPAAVAAARWLAEVYGPLTESVPDSLREQLEPAELFHNLLEHRYLLSEERHHGVANDEALSHYLETVLAKQPPEKQLEISEADIGTEELTDDRALTGPAPGAEPPQD